MAQSAAMKQLFSEETARLRLLSRHRATSPAFAPERRFACFAPPQLLQSSSAASGPHNSTGSQFFRYAPSPRKAEGMKGMTDADECV